MIFLKNILYIFIKVYMYNKLKVGGVKFIFKFLIEL